MSIFDNLGQGNEVVLVGILRGSRGVGGEHAASICGFEEGPGVPWWFRGLRIQPLSQSLAWKFLHRADAAKKKKKIKTERVAGSLLNAPPRSTQPSLTTTPSSAHYNHAHF